MKFKCSLTVWGRPRLEAARRPAPLKNSLSGCLNTRTGFATKKMLNHVPAIYLGRPQTSGSLLCPHIPLEYRKLLFAYISHSPMAVDESVVAVRFKALGKQNFAISEGDTLYFCALCHSYSKARSATVLGPSIP